MARSKTPEEKAAKAERRAQAARERAEAKAELQMWDRKPACAECAGEDVSPVTGDVVYPHRPDLRELQFWRCACGAFVGCHKGTNYAPLGRPAGPKTKAARQRAHAAFDPIWQSAAERDNIIPNRARNRGYRWLSEKLGIDRRETHIGNFDVETCDRVVALCEGIRRGQFRDEAAARRVSAGETALSELAGDGGGDLPSGHVPVDGVHAGSPGGLGGGAELPGDGSELLGP